MYKHDSYLNTNFIMKILILVIYIIGLWKNTDEEKKSSAIDDIVNV